MGTGWLALWLSVRADLLKHDIEGILLAHHALLCYAMPCHAMLCIFQLLLHTQSLTHTAFGEEGIELHFGAAKAKAGPPEEERARL